MPNKTPPPTSPQDAEAIALREIGASSITPSAKLILTGVFLLIVASVLVLLAAGQAASPLPDPLAPGFEDGLESASPWRSAALQAAWTLLGPLGAAAEDAYQGRHGWLFYRPDVEHLTGPPFDPAPPLAAITQLHRQLQARNIHLLVVPTPVKPAIYPERLASGLSPSIALPALWSLGEGGAKEGPFIQDLQSRGINVIDLGPPLAQAKSRSDTILYLATDTHWSPAGLDIAARPIAKAVTALLGPGPDRYQRTQLQVSAAGDTARLLSEGGAALETVIINQVLDPTGNPWRPTPSAPILLLGDSFSNIYTLAEMGWGTSAGLPAQLSYLTGHPVDTLIQNAQAATAPRTLLAHLRSNTLSPQTRLVVYQFAARELSFGDWSIAGVP